MIKIIVIREVIKIDIDQIMEIGEYCSVVEYNTDRIIVTDRGIIRAIEVILEEKILERICNPQIRIIDIRILELGTEGIKETLIMKEVGVG